MVRQDKVETVESLTNQLTATQDLIFTNFKGLSVEELETLRRKLYENQSRFRVVKNRLAALAFRRAFAEDETSEKDPKSVPKENETESVKLEDVTGLGPSTIESLNAEGFNSVRSVARAEIEELSAVNGIGKTTAEQFRDEARKMVNSVERPQEESKESSSNEDCLGEIESILEGNTALAFSGDGYVSVAEVLVEFAEEYEELTIKGGLLKGGFLEPREIKNISKLPPRRELLTHLVGSLERPLQKLIHHLKYPLQTLVRTLNEVKDQKET